MYAAAVLFLVALLDGDGVQVRHEGVQQAGLGVDGQQGLQSSGAVFVAHHHGHAFGFQRFAADFRHDVAGIGHNKLDLIHRQLSSIQ